MSFRKLEDVSYPTSEPDIGDAKLQRHIAYLPLVMAVRCPNDCEGVDLGNKENNSFAD